jgi:hypothetical protein
MLLFHPTGGFGITAVQLKMLPVMRRSHSVDHKLPSALRMNGRFAFFCTSIHR